MDRSLKRRKKQQRKKMAKQRRLEKMARLRKQVVDLAERAMKESRTDRAMCSYWMFTRENGKLSLGHEPVAKLPIAMCRKVIALGAEPVDPKGPIELLVEAAGRVSYS